MQRYFISKTTHFFFTVEALFKMLDDDLFSNLMENLDGYRFLIHEWQQPYTFRITKNLAHIIPKFND